MPGGFPYPAGTDLHHVPCFQWLLDQFLQQRRSYQCNGFERPFLTDNWIWAGVSWVLQQTVRPARAFNVYSKISCSILWGAACFFCFCFCFVLFFVFQFFKDLLLKIKFCLQLLDLSLKSPLLPSYLAAAFAKKLGRMALKSPPAGALIVIAIVHNLLRRHPSINCLVHQVILLLDIIDVKIWI